MVSETNGLKSSGVVWRRLKSLLMAGTFMIGGGVGVAYILSSESFMLSADGLVTRERVTVASPYDARVRQVLVQPGERVEAGQKIAVVESATITRTLADLSTQKAQITSRIAQLEGRKEIVKSLLPLSSTTALSVKRYLDELTAAKAKGLALDKSLNETASTYMVASERALTLKAEATSIDVELEGNRQALNEVSKTYKSLQTIYNDGVLTAPVAGYVGTNVGQVGEVLSSGSTKIAQIYTGESYALAYLPDSYMFDVEEGQPVAIKARGQTITASIQQVLPVTEALPPEFQLPNRMRSRGQLVRIAMEDTSPFAMEQKINVTSCYVTGCKTGFTDIARKVGNSVIAWANDAVHQTRITEALTKALRMNEEKTETR
jgi:multidrug resistance efflux pump